MIIVLKQGVSKEEEDHVRSILREEGCLIREMSTGDETVIGAVGKVSRDIRVFEQLSVSKRINKRSPSHTIKS